MSMVGGTRYELMVFVARLTVFASLGFLMTKWLLKATDPTSKTKKIAKKKAEDQIRKVMQANKYDREINTSQFTDHEMIIGSHLVDPTDIKVSWENIAGLESVIQDIKETVILPIQRKELFEDSMLTQAPKGILLHGPPGCGKTMIAKATAKECNTFFINLDVSILTDKWYGESQKLTAAVFSLAIKLQPCIIFIDEIDSFLRTRNSQDHEATAMMKAQFMSLWDGLITDSSCTVIVMGATNRPQDLDKAILRRMPATFHIGLPNTQQRMQVLKLILKNEPIDHDKVDFNKLAKMTEGFSGSDLQEMCRDAAVYRIRDYLRNNSTEVLESDASDGETYHTAIRQIMMEDLLQSCNKMKMSKTHTGLMTRLDLD